MTNKIDFEKYKKFVDGVTSEESKNFQTFIYRLIELNNEGANIERLMTGAIGICAEGGETLEIVKKVVYQGKPFDEHTQNHLKIELGDVLWYVTQCLLALGLTMEDVIDGNIEKLKKRYPGGEFDAYYSENRKEGDL